VFLHPFWIPPKEVKFGFVLTVVLGAGDLEATAFGFADYFFANLSLSDFIKSLS